MSMKYSMNAKTRVPERSIHYWNASQGTGPTHLADYSRIPSSNVSYPGRGGIRSSRRRRTRGMEAVATSGPATILYAHDLVGTGILFPPTCCCR